MKRFLLPTTTVLFLLLSMAFTLEPDSESDVLNCTVDDVILNLSKPVERIKFVLPEGGLNNVVLCDLKVGKTYDLYLVDVTSACGIPPEFEGNAIGGETYLQIMPTATCYDFSIHNLCDFKKPVMLSVFEQGNDGGLANLNGAEMIPITTNNSYTATELIEDVFIGGGCFDVTNVTSIGSSTGIGAFSNGSTSIGFDEGVVISSGNIAAVSGPNNSGSAGSGTGGGSDPDLQQLNSQSIFDATGIEFDFSPTLTTIDFRFVFGSEEYCEFVNGNVNDVFGFFISGPGITGPFSNNASNLALVPMTNIPISIDDVNNNTNPTYFVPNSTNCGGITNATDIQFDGYTIPLTATANVIPCETYHIKLVVGDGGDAIYDSGVFLEAGSFNAGGQATVSAVSASTGSSLVYEDCGNAFITFTRQAGDLSLPLVITYTLDPSSTATNGLDYSGLPPSITIPAGQTEVTIPLTIFSDGIPEGLETIIIDMDNSCSCNNSTATIEIQDVPPLIVDPMLDQVVCGPETVVLNSLISGGVPPLTYIWSNGGSGPSISPFVPSTSTYTVTVLDACGNSVQDDVMVEVGETPTAFISGIGDICPPGNPVAVLQIDFTGSGPYDVFYAINGIAQVPLMGITDNPYFLPVSEVGTYTILQIMVNGCPGLGSGIAVITETVIDPIAVEMDVSCWGFSDGSINVFPTGGQGPFTYSWSNPFANGENPTNLPAGNYTVTVFDDNGCIGVTSVTIDEPAPIILATMGTAVDCGDPNSGSIDLTIDGGTSPYSTIWSNGSNSEDPTGLPAGIYTVTVTDLGGCFVTTTAVVDDNNDPPTATANAPDPLSCTNTQVTINGNGSSTGTDYTYLWTTSDGIILSGENGLTPIVGASGTYQILVTNTINGCTEIATVTVTESADLPDASANAPMELDCNNTQIFIDGSGSSTGSDFTYLWTTLNGSIVSGNTSLNPTIDQAGTYQIQVTNTTNGCSQIAVVTVGENTTPPIADAGTNQMLDCNTTAVSLSGAGSSLGSNYTYLWTTSNGLIVAGETTLFPNVEAAGTYQIEVTDQTNGCTSVATVEVTLDSNVPMAVAGTAADLTCSILEISLDGSGSSSGTGYTYLWTTGNGTIVNNETTLTPTISATGTYQILVTASNGCTSISTVTVGENTTSPLADAGLAMNIDCGATIISLDGSNSSTGSDYTYLWTTSGGSIISGENTLTPTVGSSGTYQILVTNTTNGCTEIATVIVTENADLPDAFANAPISLDCNNTQISIDGNGSSTGSDFTYLWTTSDGSIVSGNTSLNPTIDAIGTYQIQVTNTTNGCSQIAVVTVGENTTPPIADAGTNQMLDCNSTTVSLSGAGSSSGSNYTYLWTTSNGLIVNGETTLFPNVEAAGTYQIEVTDETNGCTSIATVEVTLDSSVPMAVAGTAADLTCSILEITLDGTGSSSGTGFTYLWTTGTGTIVNNETTLNPTISATGTYQILVSAPNGCTSISTVTVGENTTPPVADAGLEMTINCGATLISLDGSNSSTGSEYTYEWTTSGGSIVSGGTSLNPSVDAAGGYILTVTNTATGCTSTASTIVNSSADLPAANAGTAQTLDCGTSEITLDGSGSEVGANITYLWTTSDGNIVSGNNEINPIVNEDGTYQILVTDTNNGCTAISTVTINLDNQTPVAIANAPTQLSCTASVISLDGNGSSSGGDFTYLWTTSDGSILSGDNSLAPEVNAAGTYQLLVTNTINGCTQIASVDVLVNGDLPSAVAGIADDLTCTTDQISLNGSASTGTNFTYLWTTNDGNIISGNDGLTPIVNATGTYQLLVTNNDNGCTAISTVLVEENMESPDVSAATPTSLTCVVSSVDLTATNNGIGSNYTYLWTSSDGNIISGENGLTPSVNAAGNYVLEITNTTNGCTSAISVDVPIEDQEPMANAGANMEVTCAETEVTLDGSGSDIGTNFTYLWTTSDGTIVSGEDSSNPLVGATGTYQLLVTNTLTGCTSLADVFVDENVEDPTAIAGLPQTLSCASTSAQLNGNGSSFGANFTYEWTTSDGNILSGENTLTPEINASGEYQIQVTNTDNGCVATEGVTVSQDSNAPIAEAGLNDLLNCNITSLVLDGSSSSQGLEFTYGWTTSNGSIVSGATTLNPEINAPGDYQLVVSNVANGCSTISSLVIDIDDTAPTAEAGLSQFLSCTNSELILDGTGSSAGTDYTYQWITTNGNIVSGENSLAPEVNATGTYELIVTSVINGCTISDEVEITQDSSLPVANAGDGFEITCQVFDGTLDGSSSTINNDITFEWTTTNGNIVSGANSLTPFVNEAGVYQLTLTNAVNGCTAISSATVVENNDEPDVEAGATMELNCNNENLSIIGSTSNLSTNFIYEWTTTDGNIISGNNDLTIEVDNAGTYQLMITNTATGCVSIDEVIITSNFMEPTADAGATDELNCTQAFATLDGNESSLGANFIYQWTTSNGNIVTGDNTLNPEVNMTGDYQILVTDLVNGCTAIESVFISQNTTPPIANAGLANDLTCMEESFDLDGNNSSIGTDFEYLWTTNNGNILLGNNTLNPTIDEPGTYEIQVTNTINNCVSTAEITVDQNIDTPTADAGLQTQLTCTITETQLDGNNSSSGNNITYQWVTSNGSIISDENTTTPTIGGTGTYELIVTNTISGCTANAFVEVVTDGNIPTAAAIPMGVLTCDENTVSLNGNGSSAGANFIYQWSTTNGSIVSGETSILPVVDQIGQYTLLVTNTDNGCSNETTITVGEDLSPPVAVIDQTGNTSLDCDLSSIVLDGSASQPIGNVSYSWTTIGGNILSGENTANPEVDDAGEYILTVTNLINGCTQTQSIFIEQDLSVPQVNITPPLTLTCDLTETILDAGNSSQGNYSYQWITTNGIIVSGAMTLTPLVNQIGTYQLIITDLGSNCTNEASITVLENTTPPIAEAGIADMLDCQTTSVSLNGSGSSSGPNFIYEWSTGNGNFIGGTNTISTEVDFAGSYNLEVTNTQNGCTAIDFVIVEEDENTPSGIIYTIDQPECHGDQGSIIIETVDGGTAPYVYSIDGINYYSGHIFTTEAGNYTLYAQDAQGCETQIDFEIPDLAPVEILLDSEVTIDLGDDYQIEAFTNIPASDIASISWTPSHHLSCDDCLNPKVEQLFDDAIYTLTIVNNNGCKISAKIKINVDKARAIYVPNVFTPNGDGENDIFMIYAGDLSQIKQVNTFMIYDRWGETIFKAADFGLTDPQNGWDGTFKGETMNPQVFVYWAEIEFIDGLKVIYKGDVALKK